MGDLAGKAIHLNNIGMIYFAQGNHPEALKHFENALQIFTKLKLNESPKAINTRKNIEIVKNTMK